MNVGFAKDTPQKVTKEKVETSEKYVVWHIEGGLGKNIAGTSLVKDVKEKYPDRKLIMVVSYPEIFLNNPDIYRVYRVGMTSYFYDEYINNKDTLVFRHEPYFQSQHITRKKHLIENWCDLLGIKYSKQLPKLYPNAVQKMIMRSWQREKPIMLIHTNGGAFNQTQYYSWTRDIPFTFSSLIAERYKKDYHIIQISRPSGYLIEGVEHVTQTLTNFELFSILAVSQKRILIDSSLQHAAVGMGLKSTVLWIGTSPSNFGYDFHNNIMANPPSGSNKLIDSYLFDYSFEGNLHECPYSNVEEIFNLPAIFNSIDKS